MKTQKKEVKVMVHRSQVKKLLELYRKGNGIPNSVLKKLTKGLYTGD